MCTYTSDQFPHFKLWTCHRFNYFFSLLFLAGLECQNAVKNKRISLSHPAKHFKLSDASAPHSQAWNEPSVFSMGLEVSLVSLLRSNHGEGKSTWQGATPL